MWMVKGTGRIVLALLACVVMADAVNAQMAEGPIDADVVDDFESYAGGRAMLTNLFGGAVTLTPAAGLSFRSVDSGDWYLFWAGKGPAVVPSSPSKFGTNWGSGPTRFTFNFVDGVYGFAMHAARTKNEPSTLTFRDADANVIGTFTPTLGNSDGTMTAVSYTSTVRIATVDILGFELAIDDVQLEVGVCGNGVVEMGEQCDDAGTVDGDCCSATCHFEDGTACDDGSACTTGTTCSAGVCQGGAPVTCSACMTCDAAAGCVAAPGEDGAACDDGDACSTGTTCSAGVCQGGTPVTCSPCMTCDSETGCVAAPHEDGAACDDGNACTTGTTCSAGVCQGGSPLECPACTACDSEDGCVAGLRDACLKSTKPSTTQLVLARNGSKHGLTWLWRKGSATTQADFGDPTTSGAYDFCVFDEAGTTVLMSASAPAGSGWKANGAKGFRFKNRTGTPSGLVAMVLKSGSAGKASIAVKGRGSLLTLPGMPLTLPVSVQLQAAGGACWEATYDDGGVKKNAATLFRGTGK